MTDGVYTKSELSEIITPLLKKFRMESASLFGSYARGEADADSDIDVLLVGEKDFRPLDIFGVAEELHRATGKKVDVYEKTELRPGSFRDAVLREAVML